MLVLPWALQACAFTLDPVHVHDHSESCRRYHLLVVFGCV